MQGQRQTRLEQTIGAERAERCESGAEFGGMPGERAEHIGHRPGTHMLGTEQQVVEGERGGRGADACQAGRRHDATVQRHRDVLTALGLPVSYDADALPELMTVMDEDIRMLPGVAAAELSIYQHLHYKRLTPIRDEMAP